MQGQRQEEFLIVLLMALAGGIVFGESRQGTPPELGRWLALSVTAATFTAWRKSKFVWPAFGLAFFILGAWRFLFAVALPPDDISHYARQTVKLEGTVVEEARLTENEDGVPRIRYTVEVETVQAGGAREKATGALFVYDAPSTGAGTAKIGDKITAKGKIYRPQRYGNPGQPDRVIMLKSQGITAQMSVDKSGAVIIPESAPSICLRFLRQLSDWRTHYRQTMERVMPQDTAAVIFAMLFGGYAGLTPEMIEAFTATGIVHILSVSGSHIALLAAFVARFGRMCRWSRRLQTGLVIGVVCCYAMLAGGEPPVIRAGIMGILSFVALSLGRVRDSRRLLIIVALFMLIHSPLLLFHIGFQLSFLSTAGLLFLSPKLEENFTKKLPLLPGWVIGSLSLTLAATLFTLPILAYYFQQVSVVSLLANLIIVPWLEILIVLGLIGGLLALLLPPVGFLLFGAEAAIWTPVYKLTRTVAALPGSVAYLPPFGVVGSLIYYAALTIISLKSATRAKLWQFVYGRRGFALVLGLVLLLLARHVWWRPPAELAVHFIDVGQGDAALVITPHGYGMMFDTGGLLKRKFDVGAKVDWPYLRYYGVHELAAIFLSHAHTDHAAGAGSLLMRMPVGRVFVAGEGRQIYAEAMSLSPENPLLDKLTVAYTGQKVTIDGVSVETVYAPPPSASIAGNEASNVYRLTYGNFSVLFTGDLEKSGEAQMLAQDKVVLSTILKVPHHGSKTSSSPEFLDRVKPQIAVFCVGKDNSFGHPHAEVLTRMQALSDKIYRTDEDGAIVFYTDGQEMRVETYY